MSYFFAQTPSDQSETSPTQRPLTDALRRIREVHYDRGTFVNATDFDAKEVAGFRKRSESFNKSEQLKGKVDASRIAQLGFFFFGDWNAGGKLCCSFCRRTIHTFTITEAPFEKEFDRRLIALLKGQAQLSATCPISIGLNGDDKYSKENSPPLKPESFARACSGHTGIADSVSCFWCGVGLNHWDPEATFDTAAEHVRFTPRCTWLLQTIRIERVKLQNMQSQGEPVGQSNSAGISSIKLADYSFIRDTQEIAGRLLGFTTVNYCTLIVRVK